MLNSVVLMGTLKEKIDDNIRILEVERDYKDNEGIFRCDRIKVKYWSNSSTCTFMQIKEGVPVLIKGRFESIDDKIYVIVESFDYLSQNNF